jgi:hypothetical protein
MKSHLDDAFLQLFKALSAEIRLQARDTYRLFESNPNHPSLNFERIQSLKPKEIYSVRITKGYRALGEMRNGEMYWYWIGTHAEYDKRISPKKKK